MGTYQRPIQRYHRRPSTTYRLANIQNVTDRRQTDRTSYHKRDRTTQYGRLKTTTTEVGLWLDAGKRTRRAPRVSSHGTIRRTRRRDCDGNGEIIVARIRISNGGGLKLIGVVRLAEYIALSRRAAAAAVSRQGWVASCNATWEVTAASIPMHFSKCKVATGHRVTIAIRLR